MYRLFYILPVLLLSACAWQQAPKASLESPLQAKVDAVLAEPLLSADYTPAAPSGWGQFPELASGPLPWLGLGRGMTCGLHVAPADGIVEPELALPSETLMRLSRVEEVWIPIQGKPRKFYYFDLSE